jgi:hypothetical protein
MFLPCSCKRWKSVAAAPWATTAQSYVNRPTACHTRGPVELQG